MQAVQLDYLPRLTIRHTSPDHVGQVFVPLINWLLMIGCVGLVITFRTSSALASAYGIAVTTTMLITTLIFYRVVRDRWDWSTPRALATLAPFFVVDVAFLGANIPKIPSGGWFPLAVGISLVVKMTTWRKGRQLVAVRIRRGEQPMKAVVSDAMKLHTHRVAGTAVYMFKDFGAAPPAPLSNLKHNKVLHQTTALVSVEITTNPASRKADARDVPAWGTASCRSVSGTGSWTSPTSRPRSAPSAWTASTSSLPTSPTSLDARRSPRG